MTISRASYVTQLAHWQVYVQGKICTARFIFTHCCAGLGPLPLAKVSVTLVAWNLSKLHVRMPSTAFGYSLGGDMGFVPGALGKHRRSNYLISGSIPRTTNPRSLKSVTHKSQWYHPGTPVPLSSASRRSINPRHRIVGGPGMVGPQRIQRIPAIRWGMCRPLSKRADFGR